MTKVSLDVMNSFQIARKFWWSVLEAGEKFWSVLELYVESREVR